MARAVSTFISPVSHKEEVHPNDRARLEASKEKKFSILSLGADEGGCGWYRVRQIFREIDRQGLASTYIFTGEETESEMEAALMHADVILARRGNEGLVRIIKERYPFKPIVFDHDDNTFIIQPSNEHYVDLGTEDVYVETTQGVKIPLWVSGVTKGFDKFKNKHKMVELEYMLEVSDLNTGTTERLTNVWKEYNDNAAVVRNAINFEWYPNIDVHDRDKGDEFRLGWQGGISHMGDFSEIGGAVARTMKERSNMIYYSVGSFYEVFWKREAEEVMERVRVFPWTDFRAHPYRMKSLDLDAAIIPLQEIPFNTFKSEVKFLEFAALRVPCLIKKYPPYSDVITPNLEGKIALLYEDERDFYKKLKLLYENPTLREEIADNAYEWVKKNRNLEDEARKVVELYKKLVEEKRKV